MTNKIPGKPPGWTANKRILIPIVGSHVALFFLAAIWGIHLLVCGHYKSKIVLPVLSANPADVNSIVVAPIRTRPTESNLVGAPITIYDPVAIERTCDALSKARPFSPNHPASSWECLLILNKKTGSYECVIDSTPSSKNGVLILFFSRGEWGWNVGEYRSDALGPALEGVVR